MKNESLLNSSIEHEEMSVKNDNSSTEEKLQWWGTKRMSADEFNDLMVDLHWPKYTQVKIEVVQDNLKDIKKDR